MFQTHRRLQSQLQPQNQTRMQSRGFIALISLTWIALISCGQKEPELKTDFGLAPHTVIEDSNSTDQANPLIRTRYLFLDRLRGINSSEHYRFEARFQRSESQLVLHSHFNGYDQRDGSELRFQRREHALVILLSAPDRAEVTLKTLEHFFTDADRHRFRVEIQDGIADGLRVLVWIEDAAPEAPRRLPLENISVQTAAVDSSQNRFFASRHGQGVRWGIETFGVQLFKAQREAAFIDAN